MKMSEKRECEIEGVIDHVKSVNSDLYRVKWRNLPLSNCTWEEKSILEENAKHLINKYHKHLQTQTQANKILSNSEKELLYDLLHFLNDMQSMNASIISWKSNGQCFQVLDIPSFEDSFLLRRQKISEKTPLALFDTFAAKMIELGFEVSSSSSEQQQQQLTNHLYFHPLFNQQSIVQHSIEQMCLNSISLPTVKQRYKTFQTRSAEEHRRFLQKKNAQMMIGGSMRMNRRDTSMEMNHMSNGISVDVQQQQQQQQTEVDINMNMNENENVSAFEVQAMYVPSTIGVDLNQCHLWTEYDVGQWIKHLDTTSTWGEFYAARFVENGIDGRILLESDIDMLLHQCQMHSHHSTPFIYAVNQLRNVRKRLLL